MPLADIARPDPMRAILAGLRQASGAGQINRLGTEDTFYGQGNASPLDYELAAESNRTEQARNSRVLDQSAATFVDPRLQRDDPKAAAALQQSGAGIAAAMPEIEDGPLARLLNGARMAERTLPMTRGAERTEATLDANAEARNYSSPDQAGMRDAQRWDETLNAKNAANTFMNPVVRQGRMEARREAPQDAGLEALTAFVRGQGDNPYGGIKFQDIARMFGLQIPGSQMPTTAAAPGVAGTGPQPQASRGPTAAGGGGQTISRQRINAMAQAQGKDPDEVEQDLASQGFTITP
jgi:hypothetical protein